MPFDPAQLAQHYRTALLDDVVPFWQRHSLDHECGGYFTCLNRDGSVPDKTSAFSVSFLSRSQKRNSGHT